MAREDVLEWRGCEVIDPDGDKVGRLKEIYFDAETQRPEWALIDTGLFGRRSTFVPLTGAERDEGYVRVRFQKDQVKAAPKVEVDKELSQSDEERIYGHYGLDYTWRQSGSGLPQEGAPRVQAEPHGRLRLTKYVVTEHVPIQREEGSER
jgi:sporulation protein YlmC with PRC-barrel domain